MRNEWEKIVFLLMLVLLLGGLGAWLHGGRGKEPSPLRNRSAPEQQPLLEDNPAKVLLSKTVEQATFSEKEKHPFYTADDAFKELRAQQKKQQAAQQTEDDAEDETGDGGNGSDQEKEPEPEPETDDSSDDSDQSSDQDQDQDQDQDTEDEEQGGDDGDDDEDGEEEEGGGDDQSEEDTGPPPIELTYLGMMQTPAGNPQAWLRVKRGDREITRFMEVDSPIGPYHVKAFDEDQVVLVNEEAGEKIVVPFKKTDTIEAE